MIYTLECRKQIEVNTDPQRRCYNGVHAKSEMVWTEWYDLYDIRSEQDAQDSIELYRRINPTHEYRLVPKP